MMQSGLRRVGTVAALGVLPVVTALAMFAVASSDGSLSVDFQNELYPEAERLLRWENPFPPPGSDLSHGHNLIWPPFAALVAAPFTLLSPAAANWAIALVGLACFMASLRLVGVRDWRVYGIFALWPQVIGEIRVSHLTPFLCLLLALVWRYRDARAVPGVALGCAAAIKFFLWPLGVWLAAIGRAREALIAAGRRPGLAPARAAVHEPARLLHGSARSGTDLRQRQLLAVRTGCRSSTCPRLPHGSRPSPSARRSS